MSTGTSAGVGSSEGCTATDATEDESVLTEDFLEDCLGSVFAEDLLVAADAYGIWHMAYDRKNSDTFFTSEIIHPHAKIIETHDCFG
jgi:hypothetical protein